MTVSNYTLYSNRTTSIHYIIYIYIFCMKHVHGSNYKQSMPPVKVVM